ncbi:MAG: response regulator, partial [Anaerolineales bacterium]
MVEERRVEAQPQILIVENDNQTIEVLRQALRNQGYATVTATSSVAALEKLQASVRAGDPIDLILWGAMVSDTDGGVELKELRTNEALSDIPVLMLIEKQALKDRLTALDRAVSDYLAKPFDSQELIGRIRTLLRHKAKERWLQNRNNALIALHELILQIYSIQNLDAML